MSAVEDKANVSMKDSDCRTHMESSIKDESAGATCRLVIDLSNILLNPLFTDMPIIRGCRLLVLVLSRRWCVEDCVDKRESTFDGGVLNIDASFDPTSVVCVVDCS